MRSNVKFSNLTLSWEVCCNHKLPSLCTTYQLHPNATFLLLYLKKSIEEGGSEVLSTCVCTHVAKWHTNNFVSLFSNFLCILFYYRDKEWQISVFAKCNFLCWLGRRCVTVLQCKYLSLVVVKKRRGEGDKLCHFFSRGGTQAMGWFTYIEPLRQSQENDLFQKKWQVGIADANSIKKGWRNECHTYYYVPFYVLVQQCSFWLWWDNYIFSCVPYALNCDI